MELLCAEPGETATPHSSLRAGEAVQ
uniref:Uncharacterized protein n=1 Tax=Anguilla anguilla TaxID=7936 RepID=A0A0E9T270_ANGAN